LQTSCPDGADGLSVIGAELTPPFTHLPSYISIIFSPYAGAICLPLG